MVTDMNKIKGCTMALLMSMMVLTSVSPAMATQTDQVTTETVETKSKDNSLSSLSLSSGSLSPSFKYSTTNYTATVDNEVTKVDVNAKLSNSHATITSITGNDSLKVGKNTIKITTTSQAGTTAVYTIVVTRKEASSSPKSNSDAENTKSDETDSSSKTNEVTSTSSEDAEIVYQEDGSFLIDGKTYKVSEDFASDKLLAGFEKASVEIGSKYTGMQDKSSKVKVLFLTGKKDSADTRYIVVDETAQDYENYVKLTSGDHYCILVPLPIEGTVPDGYSKVSLEVAGVSVNLYEPTNGGGFYLFYGVNQEGTATWYQYDATEGTYQRYNEDLAVAGENSEYIEKSYTNLKKDYNDLQMRHKICLFASLVIGIVLLIIVIALSIKIRRSYSDEEEEEEEEEVLSPRELRRQERRSKKAQEEIDSELVLAALNQQGQEAQEEEPSRDDFADEFVLPEELEEIEEPSPKIKSEIESTLKQEQVGSSPQKNKITIQEESDEVKEEKNQRKARKVKNDFDDILDLNDL